MKKLPFVMLTLLILAACNNNSSITPSSSSSSTSSSSSETNDERYAIYIKAQAAGFTGTYQEWLNSIKGADGTSLLNGTTNPTSSQGKNGDTFINTSTWDVYVKSGGNWTKVGNILGTKGADGLTPHIGTNGNWWIGTTDTNVPATGPSGTTPNIGNNGNWWIGETDTGVKAALTINTLTVTFKPENGQANFTQQVNQYHLVTKPTNPTKADHQFTGWFTDLDEQWVFSGYPLTQNLTLTAKYQVVENGTDGLLFTPTIYEGKQSYVVSGYEGTSTDVIIPNTFNNIDVVGVGKAAFFEQRRIENIIFSDSIKFIGQYAFYDNPLTYLNIPNTITTIGQGAFYSQQHFYIFTEKTIRPNGWHEEMAYNGSIIFGYVNHGVFNGFDYAIIYSNGENSVIITNSVNTGIVVIPSSIENYPVTIVGDYAFQDNKITSLTIPNSVITIGIAAFSNNQLTSLTIPNSVITIGLSAFADNQISSVTIPESVTYLTGFDNNQLTSVTIPTSVTTIGFNAFSDNKLISVTIPNSVTTIEGFAFYFNPLTSVNIPSSVTTIGSYVFAFNQFTSVSIPNSVTTLGEDAFISNQPLTIYVEAIVKPQGWNNDWSNSNNSVNVVWGYTED